MASPPFSSTESAVTARKGKSKGREPSQAPVKKGKKRGMGVEALERLRTQEIQKWVNMRDAVASAAAASQLYQSGIPITHFVEPGASVPVDYGEAGSKGVVSGWIKTTESATVAQFSRSGAAQYPTSHFEESPTLSVSKPQGGEVLGLPANIGGIWGWNGGMLMQKRAGNGGFSGGYTTDIGSGQYLGVADHPEKADGIPNFRAQFNNSVYETSQELSSMPNSQQYFPVYRCDVCLKKKRWNGKNTHTEGAFPGFYPQNDENNHGSSGLGGQMISSGYSGQNHLPGFPYRNAEILNRDQINGSPNLPGLQFGSSQNLNGYEINGFSMRGSLNAVFNQGIDMAASVHQKGVTTGSQFLLEQEFFPKENITSSSSKEESAFAEAIGHGATNSNPFYSSPYVDLSLKL